MSIQRCMACGHTTAIHDRDGTCPRWAGRLDRQSLRVVIRVASRKWADCSGHLLAFLADTADITELGSRKELGGTNYSVGTVVVWDLDTDIQEEMPLFTVREPWSSKPTSDQRAEAVDRLRRDTGELIKVVGVLGS
jgi:hypothetical protein